MRLIVNVNNGRWKHISRINSSKCIKKVMSLCAMGRLWDRSCCTASEKLLKCLSKVCLCNCLPELSDTTAFPNSRHGSTSKRKRLLLLFVVIFSASLSGSDNLFLFDLWDGNGAYLFMFYSIFQICVQV